MNMLSIVIPAYNEEKRLPKSIEKIENYLTSSGIEAEIIIVVEKSEDMTLDIAKKYQKIYPNISYIENDGRYGKGFSVRRGVLAARGDLIMFVDSDLSVPINEIEKFMPCFNKYDCCIGERIQIKKQPLYRRIMGICFRYINGNITGITFKDTQCGFKMFTRKFAKLVFNKMEIDGFSFDVEMLLVAKIMGLKVNSLKVPWYNDEESKVSPVADSVRMLIDLFRIKRRMTEKESNGEFSLSWKINFDG
ncbi:MAG: glycosyltransferase [Bacillota bacterium]